MGVGIMLCPSGLECGLVLDERTRKSDEKSLRGCPTPFSAS